ncbi:hypothetical protein [Streptomyces hoynatensis]|uniref:Uncharacterized protein n=1 Tax=Streptomyces hoynatensis TaxID=1141874 RepID=A0A3A9ZF83_9ACTN|nr:hypothetical protein [Streptomyces hoynatensis]RKN47008.1 hypothetical protein D7294_02150 [Streptomyces hoynatensis]
MLTQAAYGNSRLLLWLRVREFAVPPSMIETATARRLAGDWAGACAAAGFDVDLDVRFLARVRGREFAGRVRDDLRYLAPDLLRWHLPRIAPDGLLRPGLTVGLARYEDPGGEGGSPVHLVARTPPAWADAGQRVSLALWDGRSGAGARRHPHPRPSRRFRLDLHRHLWDARRAGELRARAGAEEPPAVAEELLNALPQPGRCAVWRWADEAGMVLGAEGRTAGAVAVRLGRRRRLVLERRPDGDGNGPPPLRLSAASAERDVAALPVLPDAATWVLPDLALLRAGLIEPERLHPLVAAALAPDRPPSAAPGDPDPAGLPRLVECRGARHRIGLVNGVLAPLDHSPAEIRREELLAELTGTPLPCLQVIDQAHRDPGCLPAVRERLGHGDIAGALAVVEGLLGPEAVLRGGALRDELAAAARRRIDHGLFRAGLAGPAPGRGEPGRQRPRDHRARPRHAFAR